MRGELDMDVTVEDSMDNFSFAKPGEFTVTIGANMPEAKLAIHRTGPHFQCPKCGYEDSQGDFDHIIGISVTIPPYTGRYCIKCYARWISETFPAMVEIPSRS